MIASAPRTAIESCGEVRIRRVAVLVPAVLAPAEAVDRDGYTLGDPPHICGGSIELGDLAGGEQATHVGPAHGVRAER